MWIKLEIFGLEYKQQMMLVDNQDLEVQWKSWLKMLWNSELYGSCHDLEWTLRCGLMWTEVLRLCLSKAYSGDIGMKKTNRFHVMGLEVRQVLWTWLLTGYKLLLHHVLKLGQHILQRTLRIILPRLLITTISFYHLEDKVSFSGASKGIGRIG